MNKHDKHYSIQQIEPIDVIENFLSMGSLPPIVAFSVAQALKYILRSGLKEGQPWNKELQKAMNYLYRALNGRWFPDDKIIETASTTSLVEKWK